MDHCFKALGAIYDLEIVPRPKFHAWAHLAMDPYIKGCPAVAATWVDEGLNKLLKGASAFAQRHGWHERTLANANSSLDRRYKRRLT